MVKAVSCGLPHSVGAGGSGVARVAGVRGTQRVLRQARLD